MPAVREHPARAWCLSKLASRMPRTADKMSALPLVFEIDLGHRLDDLTAKLDHLHVIRMNGVGVQHRAIAKDAPTSPMSYEFDARRKSKPTARLSIPGTIFLSARSCALMFFTDGLRNVRTIFPNYNMSDHKILADKVQFRSDQS